MKNSCNSIIQGIVFGILGNTLGTILFALILGRHFRVWSTLLSAFEMHLLGVFIGLGAIVNLLLFFVFLRNKREEQAKGVLIATFVSAIGILILKFL